jgi:uncharacterized protein
MEGNMHQTSKYTYHSTSVIDEGLRSYMLRVYGYMSSALGVTGFISFVLATFFPGAIRAMMTSSLGMIATFSPLALYLVYMFGFEKMRYETVLGLFYGYAIAMGISSSFLFMIYTSQSISQVFFITSTMFGSMSLYGYTTKKDLSSFGSFLMMGMIGLCLASVVNIFLHSSALMFVCSCLGVLMFTGLTAYDTYLIKSMYYQSGSDSEYKKKIAVHGALMLYMDFIGLFRNLLHLIGTRNND